MKEECSQQGSGYIAFINSKNKNELRAIPIKHWILLHKNVKYTDEKEYNEKVKKAEEEFLKLQKGSNKARKLLSLKKKEEGSEAENEGKNEDEKGSADENDAKLNLGVNFFIIFNIFYYQPIFIEKKKA